jgi:sec-independent protein translocase protein TatB
MQLLGIGPLEFLLIIVVAVIVLGPKGMVRTAQEAGKLIRKIVRSPVWRDVVDTSREIRELPRKFAREAGIEAEIDELRRSTQGTFNEINHSQRPDIGQITKKSSQDETAVEEEKKNPDEGSND